MLYQLILQIPLQLRKNHPPRKNTHPPSFYFFEGGGFFFEGLWFFFNPRRLSVEKSQKKKHLYEGRAQNNTIQHDEGEDTKLHLTKRQ